MKWIFVTVVILLSVSVNAAEWSGKVENFYVNDSGLALLKVSNNQGSGPSECATGLWPFKFSVDTPVANEWISMILAFRMSGDTIKLGYTPANGGNCQVVYIYFTN